MTAAEVYLGQESGLTFSTQVATLITVVAELLSIPEENKLVPLHPRLLLFVAVGLVAAFALHSLLVNVNRGLKFRGLAPAMVWEAVVGGCAYVVGGFLTGLRAALQRGPAEDPDATRDNP